MTAIGRYKQTLKIYVQLKKNCNKIPTFMKQ